MKPLFKTATRTELLLRQPVVGEIKTAIVDLLEDSRRSCDPSLVSAAVTSLWSFVVLFCQWDEGDEVEDTQATSLKILSTMESVELGTSWNDWLPLEHYRFICVR